VLSGAIVYLVSRVTAAAATFLSLYFFLQQSVDSFALYVVCTTAGSILNAMMFQGIRMAYQRYNRGEDADFFNALAWRCFFTTCAVVFIAVLILWVALPASRALVLGSAGLAISQGWFELRLERLRLVGKHYHYALNTIVRSVLLMTVGIFMAKYFAFNEVFVFSAIISYVVAGLAGNITDLRLKGGNMALTERSTVFYSYATASGIAVTATLLSAIFDRLVVAHFSGASITAAYGLASALSQAGIVAVGQSIGLISLPSMLRARTRSEMAYEHHLRLAFDMHLVLTLPACVAGVLVAAPLFVAFGSPDATLSTRCFLILSGASLLQSLNIYYYAQILQVENKLGVFRNILVISALISSASSPLLCYNFGAEGAACAILAGQLICFVWIRRASGGQMTSLFWRRCGMVLAYCLIAFAVSESVGRWGSQSSVQVVLMAKIAALSVVSVGYIAGFYAFVINRYLSSRGGRVFEY
jgi:hypothetical protein